MDFRLTDKYPQMTFYLLGFRKINHFVVTGMQLRNLLLLMVIKIKALPMLKISISPVLDELSSPPSV